MIIMTNTLFIAELFFVAVAVVSGLASIAVASSTRHPHPVSVAFGYIFLFGIVCVAFGGVLLTLSELGLL